MLVGRSSLRAATAGRRYAAAGAALGLLLVGCGGTTKTVTVGTGPTSAPTRTQTTRTDPAGRRCRVAVASKEDVIEIIDVQRGIGGATLGMSEAQVRQKLGEPLCVAQVHDSTGPYTEFSYSDGFTVAFQRGGSYSGGASSFAVTGTRVRTSDGVGVDSPEADVKAHVAGAICETLAPYRSCHLGKYQPGKTLTEFIIARGRVTRVRIARVNAR
jgi:hypothetical protein